MQLTIVGPMHCNLWVLLKNLLNLSNWNELVSSINILNFLFTLFLASANLNTFKATFKTWWLWEVIIAFEDANEKAGNAVQNGTLESKLEVILGRSFISPLGFIKSKFHSLCLSQNWTNVNNKIVEDAKLIRQGRHLRLPPCNGHIKCLQWQENIKIQKKFKQFDQTLL